MMRANPAQDWADLRQGVFDRLKEANAVLLQRLSTFDARPHAPTDSSTDSTSTTAAPYTGTSTMTTTELVPRVSWAAVFQDKELLQDELRQKEKRMLCLQRVFVAKTAEFREALSAILGVKLAFYDNGQIRVTSQYDLGTAFVFQPAPASGPGAGGGAAAAAARIQLVT